MPTPHCTPPPPGIQVGFCSRADQSIQFAPRDLWTFTVIANLSIVALNTSLMINSILLYQVAKLAIVPFTCFVEMAWYGRKFSALTIMFITLTLIGCATPEGAPIRGGDQPAIFFVFCPPMSNDRYVERTTPHPTLPIRGQLFRGVLCLQKCF